MEQRVQLIQSNGQLVEVRLCDMTQQHLNDFNYIWKAMLLALGADDAFWDWARKKRLACQMIAMKPTRLNMRS